MRDRSQVIFLVLGLAGILALFFVVELWPALFLNVRYLGALIALQIALIGLSRLEQAFFPLLMATFLWAGSMLPFYGAGRALRWLFLGVGALGGFVLWIRSRRAQHFGPFHLVALFCVTSALVSAMVSEVPKTAVLKVVSLFLLFLYASSGGRMAVAGREQKFLSGLMLVCEGLVYFSGICHFVLRYPVFGNPNAVGAIMGVVVVPVLLWGAIVGETRPVRQRRFFALALCGVFLYLSSSRASILAAAVAVVATTVALRRWRLLVQCAFVSVFFLTIMGVVNPAHMQEMFSTVTGRIVFKEGGTHHGVLGSRLSPWEDTYEVVKQHPWFGSGFGTSELGDLRPDLDSSVHTMEGTNREHGNSYFALAEYLGIFGALPFLALLFLLVRQVGRVFLWMRRTRNPYHPRVPLALVVLAGLLHACFEDWLFAVGSYLCVFFWVSAFVLMDMAPEAELATSTVLIRRGRLVSPAPMAHPLR